ncbi:MAG: type II toxin-antitoxin system HicA family toxin [Desulfobacteraceae bacterium]
MTKIQGINHKRVIRAFEKVGFKVARQGKHTIMTDGIKILTIPRANPIDAYTLGGIVKDAGLSVEDFRRLL